MPRLSPSLLRHARSLNPLLPALLRPCRTLSSAQNELRWLDEHAERIAQKYANGAEVLKCRFETKAWKCKVLRELVRKRGLGTPLQYLLGSEYFGDLEVFVRRGVLVPRCETAASTTHLARLLRRAENLPEELKLLDLCTGSGCIPLLFQHEMRRRQDVDVSCLGVDVEERALRLARYNLCKVGRGNVAGVDGDAVRFVRADVLRDIDAPDSLTRVLEKEGLGGKWDVLTANPPYVSLKAYWSSTALSVRHFEPRRALQAHNRPEMDGGDTFYPRILRTARLVDAQIVLLEVADLQQGLRVAGLARDSEFEVVIWRDVPDQDGEEVVGGIRVIGKGHGRSVVCWRGAGGRWLGVE
ncbi:S-adenosyl-L-methionine-dependent methyltransferase [Lojkania enalia]|uniref:S-adenosyl-L-methionine-dependent methyltransferase n=1 Tax=Lojkania enalia TaxID=147567 RepID=A0A9P4K7W4_9PLEO|nr:S-adenosyl-L-methionine-dependent methyltransferase [Didymosphaeria enalia]